LKKGVVIILIAICAIVFGVSAYQLINYYGANNAAESDFKQLLPSDVSDPNAVTPDGGGMSYDFMSSYYESLREQNSDMVGWLRIPGTRVSYPVMQTTSSPEYYLDKNFQKQYSSNGSLFAASISDVNLPSDVVIIYGHRMKTGAMFGSLGDFLKQDFFDTHDTIIFDTFTGRNEYKIYGAFSLAVGTGTEFDYYDYNQFWSRDMYDKFMTQTDSLLQIKNPSYRPMFGDKILLLSTCEYTHTNGRLVLVAVRVENSTN